jgi:hypothetical protein
VNRLSRNSIKGDDRAEFSKVAEDLYRRTSTGVYYALLKRGGKQFRRLLKTAHLNALLVIRSGDWFGVRLNPVWFSNTPDGDDREPRRRSR